ncbi:MAG: acylphosphatase [Gammaproteobacteria bacterium]|nr:acylphosphatase [Gammaproteobacteria bacterium]
MNLYRQIFVSGRVQGVFFRESTRYMATELKLSGGVRNLSDGRVEVQVAGDDKSVQSLIKWLKTGPKLAKVSTIEVLELEVQEQASDFLSQQQNVYFEIWATK